MSISWALLEVVECVPITARASGSLNPALYPQPAVDTRLEHCLQTRQIEEIRVLVEVIEDMSGPVHDVGCSDYCYRIGRQQGGELCSSLRILARRDARRD